MINWKYIKGLNQTNGTNTLYSFIFFQNNSGSDTFAKTPSIKINTNNSSSSGLTDLGHIITQNAIGQHIDQYFYFNNLLELKNNYGVHTNKTCYLISDGHSQAYTFALGTSGMTSTGSSNVGNYISFINASTNNPIMRLYKDDYKVDIPNGYLQVGNTSHAAAGDVGAKNIYSSGKCEAVYFNATSDKRAKTDFKPLSLDALKLINDTNLYSFRYKDTDLSSIGIIAQDVQNINIDGFKLVDNESATGIDMDYMTIHESKLVYVLWKAIQEQQKEIEELKKRLQ